MAALSGLCCLHPLGPVCEGAAVPSGMPLHPEPLCAEWGDSPARGWRALTSPVLQGWHESSSHPAPVKLMLSMDLQGTPDTLSLCLSWL